MRSDRWRLVVCVAGLLASPALRAHADAPVRLVLRVASEDDRALLPRLRGQLSDTDTQLMVAETPQLEAAFADQLAQARRVASEHDADAVVWCTTAQPQGSGAAPQHLLHMLLRRSDRVLTRELERSGQSPLSSTELETAALLVRSALSALTQDPQLGQPTEQVLAAPSSTATPPQNEAPPPTTATADAPPQVGEEALPRGAATVDAVRRAGRYSPPRGAAASDALLHGAATVDARGRTGREALSRGAAARDAPSRGAAAGEAPSRGAAAGEALPRGAAAGDALPRGAAAGDALPRGAAAGDALPRGAAAGDAPSRGVASGDAPSRGAAAGDALPHGAAAGDAPSRGAGAAVGRGDARLGGTAGRDALGRAPGRAAETGDGDGEGAADALLGGEASVPVGTGGATENRWRGSAAASGVDSAEIEPADQPRAALTPLRARFALGAQLAVDGQSRGGQRGLYARAALGLGAWAVSAFGVVSLASELADQYFALSVARHAVGIAIERQLPLSDAWCFGLAAHAGALLLRRTSYAKSSAVVSYPASLIAALAFGPELALSWLPGRFGLTLRVGIDVLPIAPRFESAGSTQNHAHALWSAEPRVALGWEATL